MDKLQALVVGSRFGKDYMLNETECLYCAKNSLIGKNSLPKLPVAAAKAFAEALAVYETLRQSGRTVRFDHSMEGVMYVYPPGNAQEQNISEYVLVMANGTGAKRAAAIDKAIKLGRQLRKDGLVATVEGKECRFIKLRQMFFEPVSQPRQRRQ